MTDTRTPREATSREQTKRPQEWRPPSALPTPDPKNGYVFRWVRMSAYGKEDPVNMSSKMREGWAPCLLSEHPELKLYGEASGKGHIEYGGLILCKMPVEMVHQRNQYYAQRAEQQAQSVDNNYLRDQDPRMPKTVDRKSRVSNFGAG